MNDQKPWPAALVEMASLEALSPFTGNARTHTEAQIETIAQLMVRFGFTMPILRDENGTIIAGHARLKAASLNRTRGDARFGSVPVMTATGWSDDEKRAYAIADNQSALLAGWNFGILTSEIQALSEAGFDTGLLGFSDSEIRRLTGYSGLVDPDAVPFLSDIALSRRGDMWELGAHRLLCGDATSVTDVSKLLQDKIPALMVTDPPYGVRYRPEWRREAGVSTSGRMSAIKNDDRVDWTEAWALFPGPVAYVWHAGKYTAEVKDSLTAVGFAIRSQIIWRKARFAIGRGDYHWQHEPCWYAVRNGKSAGWVGGRKQSTVWDIESSISSKTGEANEDAFTPHSTQKPVECMRRPIENNSVVGDIIYEPFAGSGTTFIAAEQCERICYGIEIDPRYVDVTIERWQRFTGRHAKLSDTEKTFETLGHERSSTDHGSERSEAQTDRAAAP